jgi:predicted phage terminase large subunit-like protein
MQSDVRKVLLSSLFHFALRAYAEIHEGRRLDPDPYLELLAEDLQRVARGETRRLVVSMPPRHGKSWFGSKCLPAYILALNPAARIMLVSYSADLAEEISYDIRQIMRSPFYRQITATRIAKDRAKVGDFATTAGGRVRAVSIEGGVTGRGADFLIVDDPVEIKDCENAKRLARVNELFDNELRTRLDNPKRGAIVIIAHRVAEDDLSGHVLQQPGWRHLRLPLIAPRAITYDLGDGREWKRRKGEPLRPKAMTATDIARMLASQTKPGFETLQQQNPGVHDRLHLTRDHFVSFAPASLMTSSLPVVLSIDPGQKGGPTNSFSIVQAWAVGADAFFLLDQWRAQARYAELRHATRRFAGKYRASVILIEETGQGPALCSDIKPKGRDVVPIHPTGSKVDRLRRHRGTIRSGRVRLPENADWVPQYLDELTLFPRAEHDDQVDATTQFLAWIAENPTPKPRPPRALAQGVTSQGVPLAYKPPGPTKVVNGCALACNSWARWRW